MKKTISCLGYQIEVGAQMSQIAALVKDKLVVTDQNVFALYASVLGLDPKQCYIIEAGEQSKTLQNVQKLCQWFLDSQLNRNDAVVALGGGVVGDLAGFACSVFKRGIKYINVPTTLLAAVDSAIGGKTAVNLQGVKNIVGSFWQPLGVFVCGDFFDTLNDREFLCGIGEIVKTAFLQKDIFDYLQSNRVQLRQRNKQVVNNLVAMCAQKKAEVVNADERETLGIRKQLNLGHTIGHALETLGNATLSHGEYVLNGIYYEAELFCDEIGSQCQQLKQTAQYFLPKLEKLTDIESIINICGYDKKNENKQISFVLALAPQNIKEVFVDAAELEQRLKKLELAWKK